MKRIYKLFFKGNVAGVRCCFFMLVVVLAGFSTMAQTGVAPVDPPSGGFAVDGNLLSNTPTAGVGDWFQGPAGSGGHVFNIVNGVAVPLDPENSFYRMDLTGNANLDGFTQGSKVNDDPNDWRWSTGSVPQKDDLNNVFLHFSRDAQNNLWVMMAGDRRATNGTSYLDFEIFQQSVFKNEDGTFTSLGTDGGRTVGDMILTVMYTNGGSQASILAYRWLEVSPGNFDYVEFTPPVGSTFAASNIDGPVPTPLGAFGKATYDQFAFAEAAVNINALIEGYDRCLGIATVFVKTKASASPTAALKDMVEPIQVNTGTTPLLTIIEENDPICEDTYLGSIKAKASAGHPPFTFSLVDKATMAVLHTVTDVAPYQEVVFGNLGEGDYIVEVLDAEGCAAIPKEVTLVQLCVDPPEFVSCPTEVVDLGCNPETLPDAAMAITAAGSYTIGMHCGEGTINAVPLSAPVAGDNCSFTQTWKVTVTDICLNSDECYVTFTWVEEDELIVETSGDLTVYSCDYENQAALTAAYEAWLAGFSVVGGCDAYLPELNDPAPLLCDGGSVLVEFSAASVCYGTVNVSETFTVVAPEDVTYNMPDNMVVIALVDVFSDQDVIDAFNDWLADAAANLDLDGGCDPQVRHEVDGDIPELCSEGGVVSVTWYIEDLCYENSFTRTFTLEPVLDPGFTPPLNVALSACDLEDQAHLDLLFAEWIGQFTGDSYGEFLPGFSPPDGPTLAEACEGYAAEPVVFTAGNECFPYFASSSFVITAADELLVYAPGNENLDACDFEDQAALNAYFMDWLAEFYFAGGCDPEESGLDGHVAPDLCEGGTVTVNYSVDDLCDSESLTRTFILTPISPVAWDQLELPETYLELECDEEVPDMAILTASNSCGPVQVLMASSIALGECPNEYFIARSWTAVGVCGDEISHYQEIVVRDTKGPELVGDWVTYLPFLCGETVVVPRPEFEDNCTEMVETVCEVVGYPGADCYAFEFPEGVEVELKFYAEDECGNASLDYYVTIYLEPCEVECETAYALGSNATCFIDEGFGNWGWTNYIAEPGIYDWPLWAAAAQCDPDNGVLAGSVSVEYDVYGFVNVTFNLFPGFTLEEEHIYAGYSMFPTRNNGRPTIAPGQYTNNGPFTGGIYVIVHAVVCGHFAAEVASLPESESFTVKDAGVNMIVTPNPFRDHAQIAISAEADMQIAVEIYNLQGARVAVLYEGMIFENDTRIINYEAEGQFDGTQILMVVVRSQYGISTRKVLQTR